MQVSKPLALMRRTLGTGCLCLLLSAAAWSQTISPAGLWKNIDDASGKPRALIRITDTQGILQGRIERVFPAPGEESNPKCVKCTGANRGAPVVGLLILSGLRKDGDEYVDGQILDPDSGSTYRSKLKLLEGGAKLSVRGYIGIPTLGRSQVWVRQE